MPCPSGDKYTGFEAAFESLDLWEATYCTYATPMGPEVVGTLFYGAVSLAIFVKTGSIAIPAILFIILGATLLAEMLAVVTPFIALIVLLGVPIAATAIVWTLDRLG